MGLFHSPQVDARYLPLNAFTFDVTLDRLKTGADNIRTDVHFSEDLHLAAQALALTILAKHSRAGRLLGVEPSPSELQSKINAFKHMCRDVMQDAVNRAKIHNEIQINTLCQVALIKLVIMVTDEQYETLVDKLERRLRDGEISSNAKHEDFLKLQQLFRWVQSRKRSLVRAAVRTLAEFIRDSQRGDISRIRESSFGKAGQMPEEMLTNPLLNSRERLDSRLAMTEYGILVHAPLAYEKTLDMMGGILKMLAAAPAAAPAPHPAAPDQQQTAEPADTVGDDTDTAGPEEWLMAAENADMLFNVQNTKNALRNIRRRRNAATERRQLKMRVRQQTTLTRLLKAQCRRNRFLKPIAALPEAAGVLPEYSPPLTPQEVVTAMISGRGMRYAASRLKQAKPSQKKERSMRSLKAAVGSVRRLRRSEVDQRILAFAERFFRFHRDWVMWRQLLAAMEGIHIVTDDRHVLLSRANFTLYEFLLPHERIAETKPVIGHVILKSDLRGSTDITYRLNEAGLNPAAFFSLNFFNPITKSLAEYGAEKVFIEGDAIILSIFEHEETPEGWYAVSRACGLAVRMIQIVKQVNNELKNTKLPKLEQGIGIGYLAKSPTFLFDGVTRIMISPVINLADRMSGCAKVLRKGLSRGNLPFHLEVFKASTQTGDPKTADDLNLRYNLNGIEISETAFKKLATEIDLRTVGVRIPGFECRKTQIYTGTFPTVSGHFHRLVIRKSPIAVIDPESLEIRNQTDRYFYEVCTHPALIQLAEKCCAEQPAH
jgi:hypothetical protein